MTDKTQIDKFEELMDGYIIRWRNEIRETEEKLREYSNANPNSPLQVAEYIYDDLKLKPIGEGVPARSVSGYALSRLAEQHEFPRLMMRHRLLSNKYAAYKRFQGLILEEE